VTGVVPDPRTVALFVVAAVALILAPGPDSVFVLSRGVRTRIAGVYAALGVSVGVLLHTTAATLGLSVLLRTVPTAYVAVKYVGAAYLLYLAAETLRGDDFDPDLDSAPTHSFRRGVAVNVLNPKVALFFLAFLPQFTGDGAGARARMIVLGATYAVLTACYLVGLALVSDRARRAFDGPRLQRGLRWTAGSVLAAFGAALALGT
jgi:threonine/homoserine/homoserine lactone efflux protein